jgi:hypothetical protein
LQPTTSEDSRVRTTLSDFGATLAQPAAAATTATGTTSRHIAGFATPKV